MWSRVSTKKTKIIIVPLHFFFRCILHGIVVQPGTKPTAGQLKHCWGESGGHSVNTGSLIAFTAHSSRPRCKETDEPNGQNPKYPSYMRLCGECLMLPLLENSFRGEGFRKNSALSFACLTGNQFFGGLAHVSLRSQVISPPLPIVVHFLSPDGLRMDVDEIIYNNVGMYQCLKEFQTFGSKLNNESDHLYLHGINQHFPKRNTSRRGIRFPLNP